MENIINVINKQNNSLFIKKLKILDKISKKKNIEISSIRTREPMPKNLNTNEWNITEPIGKIIFFC